MDTFLQGVGALALFIVGGAWLIRNSEERAERRAWKSRWEYLQARRLSHPEDFERCDEEMTEMLLGSQRKKRRSLF